MPSVSRNIKLLQNLFFKKLLACMRISFTFGHGDFLPEFLFPLRFLHPSCPTSCLAFRGEQLAVVSVYWTSETKVGT